MVSKIKVHIQIVYILTPLLFILLTSQSILVGDETKNTPKTTPYDFGMPNYLMVVITPSDNPTTQEGVTLGRKLFYDPILSGNNKQSCASCHKQELAFTDGKDISVGTQGKKAHRNSMALVNLGWQDRYFWDGKASTLEEAIHFPVMDSLEMNADTIEIEKRLNADTNYKLLFKKAFGGSGANMQLVSKAISQFLRTIVSYNSPFDHIFRDYIQHGGELGYASDSDLLKAGMSIGNEEKYDHDPALIKKLKDISPSPKVLTVFSRCVICHYNSGQVFCINCVNYTTLLDKQKVQFKSNGLYVNGKDKGLYSITGKEKDKYLFKAPTFRNLNLSGPYMHDGRFKTLDEVIEHYNSGIQPNQNLDTLLMDENKRPIRFNLTGEEKRQLLGILKLFQDSTIITDARFSEPTHP